MFLKILKIELHEEVIREIRFRKGFNLIVDETGTDEKKESGNNLGKTTVLRLVNFCLGGTAKAIYQDPEFPKKSTEKVKTFLERGVLITLVLQQDFESSGEITIRRNFLSRSKKILTINGKKVLDKDFDATLKSTILGFDKKKPTFKCIKAKNIRDDPPRLDNTIKVLDGFTKDLVYEELYFFWLGVEVPDMEKKTILLSEQKVETTILSRLEKNDSEPAIEQFLEILKDEIEELEREKNRFGLNDDFEKDLTDLNFIRSQISQKSTKISRLKLRETLINESEKELNQKKANVDIERIKSL